MIYCLLLREKGMRANSEYNTLLNNLSRTLCEHVSEGFSGELIIKYRKGFCLFTIWLEIEARPDTIERVTENLNRKVVAFSKRTEHNRNGNEAGYKVMAYNQGKRLVVCLCYKYKVNT